MRAYEAAIMERPVMQEEPNRDDQNLAAALQASLDEYPDAPRQSPTAEPYDHGQQVHTGHHTTWSPEPSGDPYASAVADQMPVSAAAQAFQPVDQPASNAPWIQVDPTADPYAFMTAERIAREGRGSPENPVADAVQALQPPAAGLRRTGAVRRRPADQARGRQHRVQGGQSRGR